MRSRFDWNSLLRDYRTYEELLMYLNGHDLRSLTILNSNLSFIDLLRHYGENETKRLAVKALKYRGILNV